MRSTRWLLALFTAPLVACAAPPPPPPPDTTEADVAAIRAIGDRFLEAFNARDASRLDGLFADDAVELPVDAPPNVGREAILAASGAYYESFELSQTATTEEITVLGDVAYAWGTWEVNETPAAGGDTKVNRGKWMEIYRRQADGTWKTSRWIWNRDTPTAPTGG